MMAETSIIRRVDDEVKVELNKIGFRRLLRSDLHLMHEWLNADHVNRWYGKQKPTFETVVRKYGAKIDGQDQSDSFLISYASSPIGYIQTYRIADHREYNRHVQADDQTAGVDLFIGEDAYIHKGFGAAILNKFLANVVYSDDSITSCVIGPEPKNKAAIRCYEKVGFRHFKTVHLPDEPDPEYLMRIGRNLNTIFDD